MTSRFGKKEKITLFSGILLIIGFVGLSYLLFIYPLKTTVKQKETELESQQKLLSVVKGRNIESPDELKESSVHLQKQIPVKPMVEQFLLDLEMAETVSNSQVVQVSFNDDATGGPTISLDSNAVQPTTPTTQTNETQNGTETADKPEGIKEIVADLSIDSGSYYDLEKFISTIEQLDRIVEVKTVDFTGPAEVTSLGPSADNKKTSFHVTLSIYYFPDLQDLAKDLPEIETESPANKSNPLSNFSDVTENQSSNK